MNSKLPNQNFCIAPWVHTFISPHSKRKLCCVSQEEHTFFDNSKTEYKPVTLNEHWNSSFMRDVRLKFLKGEIPAECSPCFEGLKYEDSYRHHFNEEIFPNLLDLIEEATKENGETSLNPKSFDYRLTNTCNLKCRMCGDALSSSWEQESKNHRPWTPQTHPWLDDELNQEIKNSYDKIF